MVQFVVRLFLVESVYDVATIAVWLISDRREQLKPVEIELRSLNVGIKENPNTLPMRDGIAELEKNIGVKARQISNKQVPPANLVADGADDDSATYRHALPASDVHKAATLYVLDCLFDGLSTGKRRGGISDEAPDQVSHDG